METTMSKIREMVDVNTIVGTPIKTDDGITLIPVSKVSFGFASGGSDFQTKNTQTGNSNFGGGSGFARYIDHFRGQDKCRVCCLTHNYRGWLSSYADELEV